MSVISTTDAATPRQRVMPIRTAPWVPDRLNASTIALAALLRSTSSELLTLMLLSSTRTTSAYGGDSKTGAGGLYPALTSFR